MAVLFCCVRGLLRFILLAAGVRSALRITWRRATVAHDDDESAPRGGLS